MFRPLLLVSALCLSLAAAQALPELPPATTTSVPLMVEPAPMPPVNVPVTMVLPGTLDGVSASLSAPLTVKGKATLVLTLKSTLNKDVALLTNRDNRQNCAFAPSIRVLKVGSRDVVYPDASGNAMLCAQDMSTETLKAGGSVRYTRTLELPAGEYMVEGWFLGSADGTRVKLGAQPVRVTVK